MFDQLFNCAETIARHQSAPLLEARVRYLQHCRDVGSPRGTLRRKARELLVVIDQINPQADGAIGLEDIEAAACRWAYRKPSHYKLKDAEKAKRHFVRAAKQWLRFLGRLQTPATPEYEHFVEEFATYMEREKGLSPMTIRSECGHAGRFLGRHCTDGRQLAAISIRQIDEGESRRREPRIIAGAPALGSTPIHSGRFSGTPKRRAGVDRAWRQRSWRRLHISTS